MKPYRFTLLLLITQATIGSLPAQTFEWVKPASYPSNITIDASGNIYRTGSFSGIVDFDPGPGTYYLDAGIEADAYVQKLDTNGNFLWARHFGDTTDYYAITGSSLTVDDSGNVYTAGYRKGSTDFDPGPGTYIVTGNPAVFTHKMDSEGNFVWVSTCQSYLDYAQGQLDMVVATTGNVYLTDYEYDSYDYRYCPAIKKLDPQGRCLWKRTLRGWGFAKFIAVDAAENAYLLGNFHSVVRIDSTFLSTDERSIFLLKVDSAGNATWLKHMEGPGSVSLSSAAVDAAGNIYMAGSFRDTVDFDPGPKTCQMTAEGEENAFVLKLNTHGTLLWVRQFPKVTVGAIVGISDMGLDKGGNVYLTGAFSGVIDFDWGPASHLLYTTASPASGQDKSDGFVMKVWPNGDFAWVSSWGAEGEDRGSSISVDDAGHVYTYGEFQYTVDFDPGPGMATLSTNLGRGRFLQKMNQDPQSHWPGLLDLQVLPFPNPSRGEVYLQLSQPLNDLELVLTDAQGKHLFVERCFSVSQTTITLPGPAGMYILTVRTPEGVSSFKLIKIE